MIKAVTLDCWGTILLDGPAADDHYKRHRLAAMRALLAEAGVSVGQSDLERAYHESGRYLARVWRDGRDVPVASHVSALVAALDGGRLGPLDPVLMDRLVDAYATPALLVPPRIDDGASAA